MKPFKLRDFIVHQEHAAMKVGTDAMLLGAWTKVENHVSALDIGAGTGILSLFLLSKGIKELQAIEPDAAACLDASRNFAESKWAAAAQVFNTDLQSFKPKSSFDLIISNPPYFLGGPKLAGPRQVARQAKSLGIMEILAFAAAHLSSNGHLNMILPSDQFASLCSCLPLHKLELLEVCWLKSKPKQAAIRMLVHIGFKPNVAKAEVQESSLCIRNEDNSWHEEYIKLCGKYHSPAIK